jgi:glutathionylspermidine synthase
MACLSRWESFDAVLAKLHPRLLGSINSAADILDFHKLDDAEVKSVCAACQEVFGILSRLSAVLWPPTNEVVDLLGVPAAVVPLLLNDYAGSPLNTVIRLDLIKTESGYKVIDINADGPGLIVPAFVIVPELCRQVGEEDVDIRGEEALRRVLEGALECGISRLSSRPEDAVFTARRGDTVGSAIAHYLMELSAPFGMRLRFVTTESLWLRHDQVVDSEGRRVSLVYRTEPLDSFVFGLRSMDPKGSGAALASLLARQKVAFANSSISYLWQSKALQALIWNLYVERLWLTEDERATVQRSMLPTYTHSVFERQVYVSKPVYGMHGDTVAIVDMENQRVESNGTCSFMGQKMVYQQHAPHLPILMRTRTEELMLDVVVSAFVVCGRVVRLIGRAGVGVTDNSWWILPLSRQPVPRNNRNRDR